MPFSVLDNTGIFTDSGRLDFSKISDKKEVYHLRYVGKCHYESLLTPEQVNKYHEAREGHVRVRHKWLGIYKKVKEENEKKKVMEML